MRHSKKPLIVALSAAFALTGGSAFAAQDLSAGYMVASIGDTKTAEHKCGEAKCGADKKAAAAKGAEAKCGADKKTAEAKCGADKTAEHKCGADKAGEHKCGADKAAPAVEPKK